MLGVDHLGSTLIKDTSVGEIVLLDRMCRSCEHEIADRNLMIFTHIIIFVMSFMDMD